MRVTDGGLRRASQTLAAQRLALGLVETSRGDGRQRKPEVRQRRNPGIRLESLAREADRLTSPRLRSLGSPLLGVDQGEQPEASDVAVGDVRRVGALDGLKRDRVASRRDRRRRTAPARGLARTPTLRTSAPARAAATARRACSTAAPTSPRSIPFARVTSTIASAYGDHSCGRSRRARSATASSRSTSTSGRASSDAATAPPAGSEGCSSSSSEGSQRTQPRNCVSRPPQTSSRSCSTSTSATVSASPAAAAYSIASSTSPCARHQAAARRRSAVASSRPSSSCRSSPNRW